MDSDIIAFRQGYYRLLVGLFAASPSLALLTALREGLPARVEAAGALHPSLGQGWAQIAGHLGDGGLTALQEAAEDEFTRLF
ncbi:MAG: hypothetical protein ACREJG_04370, partial [Candidatus Rokuibacteriota bacterium]